MSPIPANETSVQLTPLERSLACQLGEIWNLFLQLPNEHADDQAEFRHLIHAAQEKVLSRPGRRDINRAECLTVVREVANSSGS